MPSAKTQIKLTGFTECAKLLESLPEHIANVVLPDAMRAGAKQIVDRAKLRVARKTGSLRRSLTTVVRKYKTTTIAVVGPDSKYKGSDGSHPAKYAHLVEFGHANKKGRVAAKPFMRPAVDEGSPAAAAEIERVLTYGIEQIK